MESQLLEHTSLTVDQIALISTKNQVFQEIVAEFPVSLGKEISKAYRGTLPCVDHTLTYGELGKLYLDFVSLAETFEVIKREFGGVKTGGLFVDLGSVRTIQGTGKGVITGALLHDFAECWGIELLKGLHGVSEELKITYDNVMTRVMTEQSGLFTAKPLVRMIYGSFFDVRIIQIDWRGASLIFANSTCFNREMMKRLGEVEVEPGTIAVTITKTFLSPLWKTVSSFKKRMSWGDATIHISQRLADYFEDEEEGGLKE